MNNKSSWIHSTRFEASLSLQNKLVFRIGLFSLEAG